MSNNFNDKLNVNDNKTEHNDHEWLDKILDNITEDPLSKDYIESANSKWLNQNLNNTTEDSVNESPVESSKSE